MEEAGKVMASQEKDRTMPALVRVPKQRAGSASPSAALLAHVTRYAARARYFWDQDKVTLKAHHTVIVVADFEGVQSMERKKERESKRK